MTVEITKKQPRPQRTQAGDQLKLAPLRIEITEEEILADLRYPAAAPAGRS